ncbi:MAG: hypothetical protein JXQ65_07220 [Candidatus Marinimicrobia bacterium]|nr:hypothetical protein [Candidatus Neomarinimicrobiota bacterium]
MKKLIAMIGLMVVLGMAQSQLDFARQKIDKAYNRNNEKEMLEARALFERILTAGQDRWLVNYYIAYCDYRLYTFQMQKEDTRQAKVYIKDGLAQLKECLNENENFGEAYALMAAFYGGSISLNPISGMWNGPKSQKLMAEAMNYAGSSPRIFLLKAINQFYTPEKYGGGVKLAMESLEKSIHYFDEQEPDAIPAWGKTDAFTWMGIISSRQGDHEAAKKYYEKALLAEPENGWVSHVLLPQLEKQ